MTLTQRLSIKTSEQRARLGELGALDELTPELRTELDTLSAAHTDTEAQLRAAIAADGEATQAGDPTVDRKCANGSNSVAARHSVATSTPR